MPPRRVVEIRRTLPATLEALESFVAAFATWAETHNLPQRFESELVLREALTNAIVHGSACNPHMLVTCVVRLRHCRLTIAVSDQGPGFDWRDRWDHVPREMDCSGRGVGILRGLCHAIRFNQSGSRLVLVRHLL